ncbi:hypothetical protein F5884DRAFT_832721 [Xylogone sp. PMI_703]|nr:hypothetical protein F5884DRAFT_832721 [Xylogone sp. PMI_703]
MLRRKPTALTLTTEDIAIYEDSRAAEMLQREADAKAQAHAYAQAQLQRGSDKNLNGDPSKELRQHDKQRTATPRTREDRLGISGRGVARIEIFIEQVYSTTRDLDNGCLIPAIFLSVFYEPIREYASTTVRDPQTNLLRPK